MKKLLLLISGFLALFSACNSDGGQSGSAKPVKKDLKSFDKKISLSVDSALVDSVLAADTLTFAEYRNDILGFYRNRNWKYAWYGASGLREHAGYLMQFLEKSGLEGVKDSFPLLNELQERMDIAMNGDSLTTPDPLLDALLTTSFFWYADKAWSGLPEEKTKALGWFLPRYHVDKTEWLDSALQHSPDGKLLSQAVFRQYYWLRSYLEKYDSLARIGGWPVVQPKVKSLRYGDTDSILPLLSSSLYLHGDLDKADTVYKMDSSLVKGVMKFQLRHGMKADGVAGPAFFRALNVPVEKRLEQILLNMERSRWMPSDYPDRYLIVNIPDFSLYAYDEGRQIWTMNVVVGKLLHETTTFNGLLRHVVFNPYWVVPPGILYKEIIPGVLKNPNYLKKHNMEIVDRNGKVISSSSVSWSKYEERGFPYTIRQKPGNDNSLGKVKFLFPNSYSIYLHDTPSRSLFKEEKRAFSHGCVRVGDPEKLANYLLSKEGWTPEEVKKELKPGKEKWVNLSNKVPVFIVYFTAWVENDGQLHFREDVYKRDEYLQRELLGPIDDEQAVKDTTSL